ncbi:bifunctional adenosylcobinamide kinase/adenosylcobinamide-phosphate guanylyltransferase [Nocardioides yefusunii]|uniref:Adenosylcobinamide kinase n=1 Tax=Nocardioides yefusunii TaxID=2500546 RepID=A0ABW1QVF4_9ACTN|nr:bifunctional adenosylcobinamide kinase/adenosylcobinamide-phosphate guanylyltransferase [Nocardioides yefusunii]
MLVTGGVRSGKSTHAETLMAGAAEVVYVAPGPSPDVEGDPDWAARVALHRSRRPASWRTVEGTDVASALGGAGAVMVDCLGTWVTSVIDEESAWERSSDDLHALVQARLDVVLAAAASHPGRIVWVTNEVGMGLVPEHRSGRIFRDLLGTVNQRVAASSEAVHLVVAGRVLEL